ncbi:MAG: FecR domain-containing protein, partial [Sphingobacteriaceae bacterium]|nr:FecR domain-containing protein [Cytophagaceae bacterium]
MSEPLPKTLLADFFDGKATALQRQWLAEWLQNPENQTWFYLALDEWETKHPQFRADVDAAIGQFRAALQIPVPEPVVLLPARRPLLRSPWLWAASVALLLLAGGFFGRDVLFYEIHRTAYGEMRSFQLSDGSTVALNANSTLWVPRWGFGENSREVRLDGEAEFSVRHLPNHQRFVVKT